MYKGKSIAVVVPAFNEETLILSTLCTIPEYVDAVYVVDDCSTDGTAAEIAKCSDNRVKMLRHEWNRGVGAAISTGYQNALEEGIEITAVMAGDGHMDPAQLHRLLDPLADGRTDYSKGNRLEPENINGMSRWRYFGNGVLSIITKISSGYWHLSDSQNGYTAITRESLELIMREPIYSGYGYCNDILIRLGANNLDVVDVPMPARYGQEISKIKYGRYIAKVSFLLLRGFLWRQRKQLANGSASSQASTQNSRAD